MFPRLSNSSVSSSLIGGIHVVGTFPLDGANWKTKEIRTEIDVVPFNGRHSADRRQSESSNARSMSPRVKTSIMRTGDYRSRATPLEGVGRPEPYFCAMRNPCVVISIDGKRSAVSPNRLGSKADGSQAAVVTV